MSSRPVQQSRQTQSVHTIGARMRAAPRHDAPIHQPIPSHHSLSAFRSEEYVGPKWEWRQKFSNKWHHGEFKTDNQILSEMIKETNGIGSEKFEKTQLEQLFQKYKSKLDRRLRADFKEYLTDKLGEIVGDNPKLYANLLELATEWDQQDSTGMWDLHWKDKIKFNFSVLAYAVFSANGDAKFEFDTFFAYYSTVPCDQLRVDGLVKKTETDEFAENCAKIFDLGPIESTQKKHSYQWMRADVSNPLFKGVQDTQGCFVDWFYLAIALKYNAFVEYWLNKTGNHFGGFTLTKLNDNWSTPTTIEPPDCSIRSTLREYVLIAHRFENKDATKLFENKAAELYEEFNSMQTLPGQELKGQKFEIKDLTCRLSFSMESLRKYRSEPGLGKWSGIAMVNDIDKDNYISLSAMEVTLEGRRNRFKGNYTNYELTGKVPLGEFLVSDARWKSEPWAKDPPII